MSTITTKDGTEIFYKDWGKGRPVVFSHGWPLSADAWDAQMLFLGSKGFRVIAHDRRSHGRSAQTWDGNDMDTYADDLAALIEHLDLQDATMVGHSTGGGEVAHYIGRHGTKRVAKAVLIGAVPPLMLKTEGNPRARRSMCSMASVRGGRRSLAVFQGSGAAVLRLQPSEREGVARRDRFVLGQGMVGRSRACTTASSSSPKSTTRKI
jgi:Predicted hydrolases or acyltransferases (alpha/beta hydrolase superfamily)